MSVAVYERKPWNELELLETFPNREEAEKWVKGAYDGGFFGDLEIDEERV